MHKVITPSLETGSVFRALEALRLARPLGSHHPLATFVSLQRAAIGTSGFESAVFRVLINIIRRRLAHHRRVYGFSPPSRHDDGADLVQDFRPQNPELEAWSVLYYRYVRLDLGLTLPTIGERTGQSERTLRRRQQTGVVRLTQFLHRYELHTRARQRVFTLRAALPNPAPQPLIGREALLADAEAILTRVDTPSRRLALCGAPGVGKTSVALATTHSLIDRHVVRSVAWVNAAEVLLDRAPDSAPPGQAQPGSDRSRWPASASDRLVEAIALRLGLPLALDTSAASPLAVYLQIVDTLIVIDDADALPNPPETLAHLLAVLGPARVILCTDSPPSSSDLDSLLVPELDREAALMLMERLGARLNAGKSARAINLDRFNRIYDELGGNPRALVAAAAMGGRYHAAPIAAAAYREIWDTMPHTACMLWLTFALVPGPISVGRLAEWADGPDDLSETDRHDAIGALIRAGTLEELLTNPSPTAEAATDETGRIALLPMARAFAHALLTEPGRRDDTVDAIHRAAARLTMSRQAGDQIDPAACAYLIEQASRADVPPDVLLDLAYTFGPVLERAGAWRVWAHLLGLLRDIVPPTPSPDRWWVLLRLGSALRWQAAFDEAAYAMIVVVEESGHTGMFRTQAEALLELAAVRRAQGLAGSALAIAEQAARSFRRHHDNLNTLRATSMCLQCTLMLRDTSATNSFLDEIHRMLADSSGSWTPDLLHLAAQITLGNGNAGQALSYAQMAQTLLAGDIPRLARLIALMGQIHYRLGHPEDAIDCLYWAMATMAETRDMAGHARVRLNLAGVYVGLGRLSSALRYLRDLPAIFEKLRDAQALQITLENIDLIRRARSAFSGTPG